MNFFFRERVLRQKLTEFAAAFFWWFHIFGTWVRVFVLERQSRTSDEVRRPLNFSNRFLKGREREKSQSGAEMGWGGRVLKWGFG